MATFQTLQTWIGHLAMFEKLPYPSFSNLNFSNTEHVTTHYKSLQTWIGLNVTLPHTLQQHVLPYILFEIWLVLGHLQCITLHYLFFFLIINIYLLINLMVTQSNALQIAPKPC